MTTLRSLNNQDITKHNHRFDFNNVNILDREWQYYRGIISEVLHIKTNKTINKIEATQNLNNHYNCILNKIDGVRI